MSFVFTCWLLLLQLLPVAGLPHAGRAVAARHDVSLPTATSVVAAHARVPRESLRRPLEVCAPAQLRATQQRSAASGPLSPLGVAPQRQACHTDAARQALACLTTCVLGGVSAAHDFDYFPTAPPQRA